ncbi:urease accessory protein [Rhizobium sp. RU20A]|nr:urease accessory protein [Rhizobium sp. RU20A]
MGIPTITAMITGITTMTDAAVAGARVEEGGAGTRGLIRLVTWLSPAFPVGAFAYSGGLEQAVKGGLVTDAATLRGWLESLFVSGSGWADCVLLAAAHRANDDADRLGEICALAVAMFGGRERQMEALLQGEAFLTAALSWPHAVFDRLPAEVPYAVAVGAVAGAHGVSRVDAIAAYLHAGAANAVSAAIRLGVTGQTGGVAILAGIEDNTLQVARRADISSLDDLWSSTLVADVMVLQHETMEPRLFRS